MAAARAGSAQDEAFLDACVKGDGAAVSAQVAALRKEQQKTEAARRGTPRLSRPSRPREDAAQAATSRLGSLCAEGCALACRRGHVEVVKVLCESGLVDLQQDQVGTDLVMQACGGGQVEVLEYLLRQQRIKPTRAVFFELLRGDHVDAAKMLLRTGPHAGRVWLTPTKEMLKAAVEGGCEKITLLLLEFPSLYDAQSLVDMLINASDNGQLKIARALVEDHGADPAARDNAALVASCRLRHGDVTSFLLDQPAVREAAIPAAALFGVARNDLVEPLRKMLGLIPDPMSLTERGNWDVMTTACRFGSVNAFLLLLDHVDPRQCKRDPIAVAARYANKEIVEALLKDGRREPSQAALNNACTYAHSPALVRLLLKDPRVDPAANDSAALVNAASGSNAEILELLLEDGRADPAAQGNTPLIRAARMGNVASVDLLLAQGDRVDPSVSQNACLFEAVMSGSVDCMLAFVDDPRVDLEAVDDEGFTPLCVAAESGNYDMVAMLLTMGANAGGGDSAALWLAAQRSNFRIVEMLLRLFRDQVDPTVEESKALRLACKTGAEDILDKLLEDGRSDPGARNQEPLRQACKKGKRKVVQRLLADTRVDPSVNDSAPLREAVRRGFYDVVALLVRDPRVDPSANDNEALAVALRNRSIEIFECLINSGRVDLSEGDLVEAALSREVLFVRGLLRFAGIDPAARSNAALRVAVRNEDWAIIRVLLRLKPVQVQMGSPFARLHPDLRAEYEALFTQSLAYASITRQVVKGLMWQPRKRFSLGKGSRGSSSPTAPGKVPNPDVVVRIVTLAFGDNLVTSIRSGQGPRMATLRSLVWSLISDLMSSSHVHVGRTMM